MIADVTGPMAGTVDGADMAIARGLSRQQADAALPPLGLTYAEAERVAAHLWPWWLENVRDGDVLTEGSMVWPDLVQWINRQSMAVIAARPDPQQAT